MRKIFYEDINITEFTAKVVSCDFDTDRNVYKVLLDATAFFPEEGGQSADIGTLNDKEVLDVQIKDDLIYHYIKEPVDIGATVTGKVNWEQRFDFMQQHSGEHILSGLIHNRYGYNNVGFHLSKNEVTMDFNGVLDWVQIRDIELAANRIIYKNLPIEISYPTKEELLDMEYRSKIDIDGQVRIVTIPSVDACACCAPHVPTTGMIGIIKITGLQNYKGGIRLNILCGARALLDYTAKQDSVTTLAQDMSTKQENIVDGYNRLKEECQNLKANANALKERCLSMSIATLPSPSDSNNAILFTDITDNVAIRNTVNQLMENYSGYSIVFAGADDNYRFVAGSKTHDCNELSSKLRERFGAKCGGNNLMIQGSVCASKEQITNIF